MKRLVVFALLLVGGFVLLYQLVGEEMFAAPTNAVEKAPERRPTPGGGTDLAMKQGSFGATGEQRGAMRFPKVREIPQPDGSILKEMVFVLYAADSEPLRDGLQRLDDVELTLFEDGDPAAIIHSRQAIVELGRDANGEATFVADKEVMMTDVVFEALPGSKLAGLRLELARANALVDDAELHIYTPSADDPVHLTFDGARSVQLDGKGLQARLPRDRSGALQRIDVDILNSPVVTSAGISARSRGRLHYSEDNGSETAQLSMTDAVIVELDRGASLSGAGPRRTQRGRVTIHGDQLLGWLVRGRLAGGRAAAPESATWRMLQLNGGPATVRLDELEVSTPRLTVLPGPLGSPYWITASGGISRIEEIASAETARKRPPIHGSSPRRIHLWQAGDHLGAAHRAFGFPQWTLAPIQGLRAVMFEGESHLEDGERFIDASRGVHVFHPDANREGVIARGFGNVEIEQRATETLGALHAKGNDGFHLAAGNEREVIDLGPAEAANGWQAHRYAIEHGELEAEGRGTCRIERAGGRTTVALRAPDREITADLAARNSHLTNVRRLRAELDGEDVHLFAIAGVPATATVVRDGETITATAPRIEQTSRASLRMLPPEAFAPELWRGLSPDDFIPQLRREAGATAKIGAQSVTTTAPRIDVHYLGRDHVLVDALGNDTNGAKVDALIAETPGAQPVHVVIDAGRLRALPFAIAPMAIRAHAGGAGLAATLAFTPWSRPWIHGDRVSSIRIEDPVKGTFEGSGHRLLLSMGAQAGLLIGNPETLEPATATRRGDDRAVTARGAQVRVFRDQNVRLQAFRAFPGRSTFVLPELEMHRGKDGGGGVLAHVLASCQGDIEMQPDRVTFGGPVVANAIAPDGSKLTDGLGIVAQQLRMDLHPETNEVLKVFGRDVDLDWSRVSGKAAELELEPRWNKCVVRDPNGAHVVLANGMVITGERVTVDYHTLAFDAYKGSVLSGGRDGAKPR